MALAPDLKPQPPLPPLEGNDPLPGQPPPSAAVSGYDSIHSQRLLPFVFSDDERFVLIFHDLSVNADPGDGGGPVDTVYSFIAVVSPEGREQANLACPYRGAEWFDVQYKQINDVMFLAHPNYAPMRLERGVNAQGDAAEWHLFAVAWDFPPMLDENLDKARTLAFVPEGTVEPQFASKGTLRASEAGFFRDVHVGGYWAIGTERAAEDALVIKLNASTSDAATGLTAVSLLRDFTRYKSSPTSEGAVDYNAYYSQPVYMKSAIADVLAGAGLMTRLVGNVNGPIYDANGAGGNGLPLVQMASAGGGTGVPVIGNWSLVTTGIWRGTLNLWRTFGDGSDSDTGWEVVRTFVSESDRSVSVTGDEKRLCRMRISFDLHPGGVYGSDVWVGAAPTAYMQPEARFTVESGIIWGVVRVTGLVGGAEGDGREALVEVVRPVFGGEAVFTWMEGAWSVARGFPACVGMYEQRVFWANTRQKPNTIWASAIDDFQNFEYGVDDSDAFVITLAATEQNGIMWMDSLRRFHVSTKSRDFSITGGEQDGAPVSATVYNIRSESVSGATNAQPVVVNDALLFVARHGVRIHELAYSLERDGYIGNDISMLAPQLLEAGVLEIAYARQPDPVLYCLCRDGSLAAFTYAPAEKVNAWSRVKLAGKSLKAEDLKAETNQTSPNLQPSALQAFSTSLPVSGICVLPGALGDELWVCAAGVVMRMGTDRGVEAGVHLDCALIVTGRALHDWGVFADDLSYPFEKFDVVVFHSGGQRVHFKDLGFSENGALYFPGDAVKNAERCVIGLPYSGELETLPVDAVFQSGPAAGTIRRIVRVTPNFFETVSCRMGRRGVIPPVNFRNTADRMDALNAPFSGYTMPLTWPAGSSRDETIRVVQDLPFPCTLLGLAVDWEVMG